MKTDRRLDPRPRAGLAHQSNRVRLAPGLAVGAKENSVPVRPAGGDLGEELASFIRQHDMPWLAALALPDRDGPGIAVEIADGEPGQLAVAGARL